MEKEEMQRKLVGFCTRQENCGGCPFRHRPCAFFRMDTDAEVSECYNIAFGKEEEVMESNRYVYVSVALKCGNKQYLYRVPDGAEVSEGDVLIVKANNGHEMEGVASSDPVTLNDAFADILMEKLGISKAAYVVGKHTVQRFM